MGRPHALRPGAPPRRTGGSMPPANRCRASRRRSGTVETRGKSLGNIRHWHPVVAMERIASKTPRKSVLRGRPTFPGAGISGAISAYSASRASLAYLPPLRSYRGRVNSVQAIVISVQPCNRTDSQPAEFTPPVSDQPLRARRIWGQHLLAPWTGRCGAPPDGPPPDRNVTKSFPLRKTPVAFVRQDGVQINNPGVF